MCTDVDRNDKSRICAPGSVKVIGRRQIEMYSKLIHTVDHVEGYLREGFDALDAFLCHTWAVTVTGAPKAWAARFIEKHDAIERTERPRRPHVPTTRRAARSSRSTNVASLIGHEFEHGSDPKNDPLRPTAWHPLELGPRSCTTRTR